MKVTSPVLTQNQNNPDEWILVHPFKYDGGVIPKGFVTDFASIPRLFWNLISPTGLGDVGPIKHDWKYRNGLGTRADADYGFLLDMIADNIPWGKRIVAYYGVRLFGWRSWNSGKVVIMEVEE